MSISSTKKYSLNLDKGFIKPKLILSLILAFIILLSSTYSTDILAFGDTSGCKLNLSITKENKKYTFTVKNNSQKICKNVSVSVYYPDNLSYVSSNPKTTASDYYWNLGNMRPNTQKVISVVTEYNAKTNALGAIEACATANNTMDTCSLSESASTTTTATSTKPTTGPDANPGTTSTTTSTVAGEYGAWVWESPYGMSDAYMNKVINGAVTNKINVLYITIDDYLDIHNLPEGLSKESQKIKYSDSLEKFIIAANKVNIAVDVVAGWRDWAETPNTYKPNVIIDYAVTYNSLRKNKIRGIQFDVEPYLLSSYETNKAVVLKNFVGFVDASVKRLGSNDLSLTIVIPHFYDSSQKWTPSFLYGGVTTYTFDHILRILDTRPKSIITLMSYRNFSLGSDGTVEISKTEIDQASAGNHSTKIIVAQETGDVEPGYVTFYNVSKREYEKQISIIKNTFTNSKNFAGIAVHYIDPFLVLK